MRGRPTLWRCPPLPWRPALPKHSGAGWRIVAVVIGVLGLLGLAGCGGVDEVQRSVCESVVPVVEPDGARITILSVEPDPARPANVRIVYRTERRPAPDAPVLAAVKTLTCAFAGEGFEGGKGDLVGVLTSTGKLSDVRLHVLKRFWLSDRAATTAARAGLAHGPEAGRKGLFRLDPGPAFFLQQIVNASAPSALYALLALAYSLVYGLVNRINLAFGDLAMLGAFGALAGVAGALALGLPGAAVALPVAALAAMTIGAAWGGAVGRLVFAPLLSRRSQPLLVATIGVSLALQEFVARTQGARERWLEPILTTPTVIAHGPFDVVITTMQMLVVATATAVTVLVAIVLPRTRFGRQWRAVADDALMARLVGIDPARVLLGTFALSGALAGLAGAIFTLHYGGTNFAMGTVVGLKALVAAIVGGIGSAPGAILGGVVIGIGETLWSAYEDIVWRDAAVLALMAVFLVLQPDGLLGPRRALEERPGRDDA